MKYLIINLLAFLEMNLNETVKTDYHENEDFTEVIRTKNS